MKDEIDGTQVSPQASVPVYLLGERISQMVSVVGATLLALSYGIGTQLAFVKGVTNPNWVPLFWLAGATVLIGVMGCGGLVYLVNLSPRLVNNHLSISEPVQYRLCVASLFVVSFLCVFALGYFTTFTGGSFYSPYVQPLLAMALLTPIMADGKETIILMVFVVSVTFGVFSDWTGEGPPTYVQIPTWIYVSTPIIALVIGLVPPVFGKPRERDLEWRWLTKEFWDGVSKRWGRKSPDSV